MPATVIAERIGWTRSMTVLQGPGRGAAAGVSAAGSGVADELCGRARSAQCDLWFPPIELPVGFGQVRPTPAGADDGRGLLAVAVGGADPVPAGGGPVRRACGSCCSALGAVPRVLVWDGEGAVGRWRGGQAEAHRRLPGVPRHAGHRGASCRPRDPEAKGLVERAHDYLEPSFLPGRGVHRPGGLQHPAGRLAGSGRTPGTRRALGCAPTDRIAADRAAMLALPPVAPAIGWRTSTRLARDHYVRLDSNDYSVHPAVIGRRVEVIADLDPVRVTCDGHGRSPTTSGSGPGTRPSPTPTTPGRRGAAPQRAGGRLRPAPAEPRRGRAARAWPTTTPRSALDRRGRVRADGRHDGHRARRRHGTVDRRGGVPDPGAEGTDAARGGAPAGRAGPRRVLDPRGVPGRLPATRGLRPRVPRRRGPHPRRPVPGPQVAGGVRLRPRPRPQTRRHRPPGHPGLRHRQGQRGLPRPARHRQDPPGHRPGHPRLPSRAPGRCSPPPPSGSTGSPTPTTPAGCRTSSSASAATRCWSSTRSATSPSNPKPRTCSSSSSPPATNGPP